MNIIGIDIGASFLKCARISEESGEIEDAEEISAGELGRRGGKRIEGILCAVEKAIKRLSADETEVKVALSTEMHGFVLADGEGELKTDYISWQEEYGKEAGRDAACLEAVSGLIPAERIWETGMTLRLGLPSVNLYYLLRSQDFGRGKLFFYTMGDFLIRKLAGCQPYVHPTNAAATGLYNVRLGCWDEEIMRRLGLAGIVFPEVWDGKTEIDVERDGKRYVFYPAVGDQQAALLGSGFCRKGQVSLNFGTGAQVSILAKKPSFSNFYQIRPYFYGSYIKTIPHIPSGRAVNVYFRFVKDLLSRFAKISDEDIWDFIREEMENCKGAGLEADLSFFENPVTGHETGGLTNISEYGLSVGSLFAAVYGKMAENAEKMIRRLPSDKIEEFVFSGGVARKTAYFREAVLRRFPEVEKFTVAENETIKGLRQYVMDGGEESIWES